MPPKAQQQQQRQPQPAGSGCGGSKPAGGNAGQKVMNYFAALAGTADADSQLEEIAAEEDRRRQASSSSGSGGPSNGKKASAGGGLQQPLVWIDLGEHPCCLVAGRGARCIDGWLLSCWLRSGHACGMRCHGSWHCGECRTSAAHTLQR